MAKDFTEKSRFKSKYTDGYVAGPQYLVELIAEKIAAKQKTSLPYQFWKVPPWDRVFKTQLSHANKLLKEYDVYLIIKALADRRSYRIESLGAKFILEPILKELVKQARIQKATEIVEKKKESVAAPTGSRRAITTKKGLMDEL